MNAISKRHRKLFAWLKPIDENILKVTTESDEEKTSTDLRYHIVPEVS
jgi:hypothetical protein